QGVAYMLHVEAIRKPHVIGYVTKYLTKSLSRGEKGVRYEERQTTGFTIDDEGKVVEERQTYTVELVSKARRIRYSRHFFPEKVSDLRRVCLQRLNSGQWSKRKLSLLRKILLLMRRSSG